jgi:hypothetical protein
MGDPKLLKEQFFHKNIELYFNVSYINNIIKY